jgi:Tol biopolymer transport system component
MRRPVLITAGGLAALITLMIGLALAIGARRDQAVIAFVAYDSQRENSTIAAVDLHHLTAPVKLHQAYGRIDTPVWSPDGGTLYFAQFRETRIGRDLAALTLASGQFRWLTDGPYDNNTPDLSPDGRWLAFQSNQGDLTTWDIYALDLIDGQQVALYRGSDPDGRPSWSPDGQWIVFETYNDVTVNVFALNPQTRYFRRLTARPSWSPDWSPIEPAIVVASNMAGSTDLYQIAVNDLLGGNPLLPEARRMTRLTDRSASESDPVYSDEGTQIAFSAGDRTLSHIYVLEIATGAIRQVTWGAVTHVYPAWRP